MRMLKKNEIKTKKKRTFAAVKPLHIPDNWKSDDFEQKNQF